MRRLLLAAALVAACAPAHPSTKPASSGPTPSSDPKLAALLRDPSQAADIACDLSDRVGPRFAGSEGDARAVAWATAQMTRLGLAHVHAEPVTVKKWVRGPATATLLGDGVNVPLALAALGNSFGTPAGGIEGEILRVDSIEALAAMPADAAKGKIVFFDKKMTKGHDGFQSYGKTVDIRKLGATEAAKHGAIASVIRSVGTGESRFPHAGWMPVYDEKLPKIPAAALAIPDAELIDRLLAGGKPLRLRLAIEAGYQGDAQSADVIGEVVGREKPDEVMVIGAHLDAWDFGRGAIDDAAGVGVALDVAREILKSPARRTVRVVLFANEENGLEGARGYAKAHADELAKHQAVLEIDAGDGKAFAMGWSAGPSAAAVFDALGAELAPLGISRPVRGDDEGGADTIPERAGGVPSFEFSQDGTRYFDYHHTADDTCDKIVASDLAQVRDAALIATWRLAEVPGLLERVPAAPAPAGSPTPAPTASPAARPGR